MKKILLIILMVLYSSQAIAVAPIITGYTGTATDGQVLTLNGSGFGVKSPVAPLLWDNVESGIRSTDWTNLAAGITVYSGANQPANSNYCYIMDQSTATTHQMRLDQLLSSQLYVTAKRNWAYDITYDNTKFFRVWQNDYTPGYVRNSVAYNWTDGYDGPKYNLRQGEGTFVDPANPTPTHYISLPLNLWPQINVWQLDEMFVQLETAYGVYDGKMGYRKDNSTHRSWAENRGTNGDGTNHNFPYDEIYLDNFADDHSQIGGPDYLYVDDVYIDSTWLRVMIGDNVDFDSCATIEIQIPTTTWNDNQLQITLNQATFTTLTGKYLFVFNTDNEASDGYLISTGTEPSLTCQADDTTGNTSYPFTATYTLEGARTVSTCTWSVAGGASGSCTATGGNITGTATLTADSANVITLSLTDSSAEVGTCNFTVTHATAAAVTGETVGSCDLIGVDIK